ncbi:hypothetical protein KP615_09875 [Treponema denticola]|jgi:hypothetical protein|uniref:hypothetical protein n=1 Tax=Treponema denticola TaxID=158 RepID=UPI0020608AC2|nr:MAG TPA: hypothetical protein [Caudoviricetes sp.]
MAGMYPENQELSIFGERVQWPGLDSTGKFTNGSFTNPLEKPSFIPAETLNLILDNLGELIKKLGETPNNAAIDQLAKLFTSAPTANKAIRRDEHGRAKVAAPEADDDIARKSDFQKYVDQKFIEHYQKGYFQMPGMPSPLEDTSMHYEGYSWYEANYRGNFFRAKGDNANPFSSKKLTKEQIRNGDYIFQNDEQGDSIREIEGSFTGEELFHSFTGQSGVFEMKDLSEPGAVGNYKLKGTGTITFKASRVVPVAEENRSRNLTFTFWVLIKNE